VADAAARRHGGARPSMSIGEVLTALRPEFPDVTISKIRFLEDQGLVEPDRTPSGYRKFGHDDLERLRFVLAVQRDHYLPLRVIRDHLDAIDAGLDPPPLPGAPRVPRLVQTAAADPAENLFTPGQLADAADAEPALLAELESYGLVTARPDGQYDAEALAVVRSAAGLARFGIEPRHLRPFRMAADREAGLVEQVVAPLRRQRGPEAAGRADETAHEVAALCVRLHAALVSAALNR
jgi:DNA-binding transcriptional MerR regulator